MPKTYSPPRLNERQIKAVENGEYDFLVPTRKQLMRIDEVCAVLGRSPNFVRALGDEGKLEKHSSTAQTEGRPSAVYTRRSVIMHLAETSNYDTSYLVIRIEAVMKTLNTPHLDRLISFATRRKNLL